MIEEENVVVSVLCTAYNHENYIRAALDGFVMQQTNFKFEILVHDDASTDGTAGIVHEYEEKYPNLIRGIYQIENQYSQGNSTFKIAASQAKGRYFALCEGDDYWIDPLKLQRQYDALEKHTDVDICGHSTLVTRKGRISGIFRPSKKDTILHVPFFLNGGYVHTSSLMIRKKRCLETFEFSTFDFFVETICSDPNGMLFITNVMSVYRRLTPGSWSSRLKDDKGLYSFREKVFIPKLKQLSQKTGFTYKAECVEAIRSVEIKQFFLLNDYKGLVKKHSDLLFSLPLKKRLSIRTRSFSPMLGKVADFCMYVARGQMFKQIINRLELLKYRRFVK